MRKTLLSLVALLATTATFAQTNLALTGTASAPKGDAAAAIDGNTGTRWEFGVGDITDESDVSWTLDLGSVQEFNTIQILWEGAYSKSFDIFVAGADGQYGATPVVSKRDVTPAISPTPETYTLGSDISARYIKFQNVARGTQWGVSFWEFRVFKAEASVLTSLTLSAAAETAKVGTGVALTVAGFDQIGQSMDAGEVTYEVTPASAGSVTAGVFTPAAPGVATIVAKSGGVTSNEVTISSYDGDKINIFANWNAMVSPIGTETTTDSKVGAFDDNMASVWELHGMTGADEEARTYEVGFVIDFEALYDITAISIRFEGACSEDYTVAFGDAAGNYTTAYTVTGHPGMATYSVLHIGTTAPSEGVRYVKFLSTKAATQYGIKIFDFSVYAKNKQDLPDTQAPTDFTATVDESAATYTSVTLKLKATDDVSTNITYEISGAGDGVVTTTGTSGTEITYELKGLENGQTYNLSVVAKDGKGNAAAAIALTAATKMMPKPAPAPAPTAAESLVLSLYSDAYTSNPTVTFANWAGTAKGQGEVELGIGDKAYYVLGLGNIFGIEYNGGTHIDVSGYKTLHLDIWSDAAQTIKISPICGATAIDLKSVALTAGEWTSVNLPIADFTGIDLTDNYQIELADGDGTSLIYLDNIYFVKDVPSAIDAQRSTFTSQPSTFYDLQGRRVDHPTQGIYIQNGKKVILK